MPNLDVQRHYDLLIAENNDPVLDPPELSAYMDGWDGAEFLNLLQLTGKDRVLEIGVGTGRLALRVASHCKRFAGIDLSRATLDRCAQHLAHFPNAELIAGNFLTHKFHQTFNLIYSSLTMLHIRDKSAAIHKMAALLSPGGRIVLSLDKNRESQLTCGDRILPVFPDHPADMARRMQSAGLCVETVIEIEQAWLIKAIK